MEPEFTTLLLWASLALVVSWFAAPITWARALLWLGRRASGLQSRQIQVDGHRWHYLAGGEGPVLVALHGFGADADHWLRVAPQLRRRFRVVAPDLVGFGTSSMGDELAFDIPSQAERLSRFLDALGVERCILAGNSMGGWIATRLAADQPGRVAALWLLAPLGVRAAEPGELLQSIERGEDSPLSINSLRDFDRRVFRPMFARAPALPHPLRIYYGRNALRRSAAAETMFREVRQTAQPLEATATRVRAPVLLQWGAEDRAVHVSGASLLATAFADVRVDIQPGVGHLPMLEAAGPSARQFLAFARERGLDGSAPQ